MEAFKSLGHSFLGAVSSKMALLEVDIEVFRMQHYKWPTNLRLNEERSKNITIWNRGRVTAGWDTVGLAPLTKAHRRHVS